MERRSIRGMSLEISKFEQIVHPNIDLKAGAFDLDKSSQHCSDKGIFTIYTTQNKESVEIDEAAIDAFLVKEKVFPVNLTRYTEEMRKYQEERILHD